MRASSSIAHSRTKDVACTWPKVIYHELIMTTKEYMREVMAIDPRCVLRSMAAHTLSCDLGHQPACLALKLRRKPPAVASGL